MAAMVYHHDCSKRELVCERCNGDAVCRYAYNGFVMPLCSPCVKEIEAGYVWP